MGNIGRTQRSGFPSPLQPGVSQVCMLSYQVSKSDWAMVEEHTKIGIERSSPVGPALEDV